MPPFAGRHHNLLFHTGNSGIAIQLPELSAVQASTTTPGSGSARGIIIGRCGNLFLLRRKHDSGSSIPNVSMAVNTGQGLSGGAAGQFNLFQALPSLLLATPAAASVFRRDRHQQQRAGANEHRRNAIAGGRAADVCDDSDEQYAPFAYTINLYNTNALGTWTGTAYNVVGASTNLVSTWTIFLTDASTNVYNRLEITQTPAGSTSNVWLYTYNTNNGVWALSLPGEISQQMFSQGIDFDPSTSNLTVNAQVSAPGGAVVYARSQLYTNYGSGTALLTDTVGTNSDARVTSYTYCAITNFLGYVSRPLIQSVVNPDGTWTYIAGYNTNGLPTGVFRPATMEA